MIINNPYIDGIKLAQKLNIDNIFLFSDDKLNKSTLLHDSLGKIGHPDSYNSSNEH